MKRSFPLWTYIAAALWVAAMYGGSLATAQTPAVPVVAADSAGLDLHSTDELGMPQGRAPAFNPAELPTQINGVVFSLAHTDLAAQANLQFYPLDDNADLQT